MYVFDYDKAALVLVDATLIGDQAACEKHGITTRTLQRWRKRTLSDAKLSQSVALKKEHQDRDWAESLPDTIRKAIEFLGKASENLNHNDPAMVHSVAGALKILTDVAMSRRLLDARISRQIGASRETDRPSPSPSAQVIPLRDPIPPGIHPRSVPQTGS